MKNAWIAVAVVASAALGGAAFVQGQGGQEADTAEGELPAPDVFQPIQFPHDVHAGTYQIDCQYCHFSAERSVDAGLPPVESCMGCHALVPGETPEQQAEISRLREYFNEGRPIPWVRIYKVPDHVHFPHMRHVNAGMECQECHGEVQEMGVLEERDPVWGGDDMGWCIGCHVERDVSRDCTVCHY